MAWLSRCPAIGLACLLVHACVAGEGGAARVDVHAREHAAGRDVEAFIPAHSIVASTTDGGDPVLASGCGWGTTSESEVKYGYVCDGSGGDPKGEWARACPEHPLAIGDPCGEITGVGCCDSDGNVWYCADPEGPAHAELRRDPCS